MTTLARIPVRRTNAQAAVREPIDRPHPQLSSPPLQAVDIFAEVQKIGRRREASRQIPALAKLAKKPKMTAKAMWKQSRASRAFSTDYRGIRIKITVDPKTEKPIEISWYLGGKLAESAPITCDLEQSKRIAEKVVDHQIETDAQWAHSEYRHNSDIWKKQ